MDQSELDPKTLMWLLAGHLRDRVVTHPVITLAGAATVGYVLGWSLPRAVLRMGGAMVLRTAMVEVIDELLGPVPAHHDPSASRGPVEVHPNAKPDAKPDANANANANVGRAGRRSAEPFVA